MYTNRLRALSRIHRAIQAGFGYSTDDPGAAGGGAGGGAEQPPKKKKKTAEGADTGAADANAGLTDADVDARIETARQKWESDAAAKAKKAEEDREAEEAKKRGEFEKLAGAEKSKREAAEAELQVLRRTTARDSALSAHLVDKHPEYVSCAKYIAPLIPADVEGDALTKAIDKAADDYVRDNPRQKSGVPPAPLPRTGNRDSANNSGDHKTVNRNVLPNGNRIVTPASRF